MAKAGIVVGAYVAAILLAFGVVFIFINYNGGPHRDASSGMYAFGDSLLFIAVFGVVSTIPTGLTLAFLRQSRMFWIVLCVVALVVASTSLAAVAVIMSESQKLMPSESLWPGLSAIRLFVSPFIAASVGLSALLAPEACFRKYLFGAASLEGVSSVYGFFHWYALLFYR